MNWLYALFALFLIVIFIWFVEDKRTKERAEQEKKDLLREKEKLLQRQKIKERLLTLLERRYHWRRNIGYTVLLISFASISLLISFLASFGYDFEGLAKSVGTVELGICIVALYCINKPVEFKHILTECAPFLKKKVFGKDINIDVEINETKIRIGEINTRIVTLNQILAS